MGDADDATGGVAVRERKADGPVDDAGDELVDEGLGKEEVGVGGAECSSLAPSPARRSSSRAFSNTLRVFFARTDPDSREANPTCWKKVMTLEGGGRGGREEKGSAAATTRRLPRPPLHPALLFPPHLNTSRPRMSNASMTYAVSRV